MFDSGAKKVWFGDIDIRKAEKALLTISKELGPLYVLHTIDGRFLGRSPSPRLLRYVAAVVIEGGRILYSRDLAERLGIIRTEDRARSGCEGGNEVLIKALSIP